MRIDVTSIETSTTGDLVNVTLILKDGRSLRITRRLDERWSGCGVLPVGYRCGGETHHLDEFELRHAMRQKPEDLYAVAF